MTVHADPAPIEAPATSSPGRFRPMQIRVLALVLLLYVVDGIDTQILSVAVAALANDWALPLSAFGTAMAAGYAGSAGGALGGGMLGDRFGRKPTVIAGALLFGAATLAMAFLASPGPLAVARFVAGLGLGGCLPPCLALLTECMPRQRHGFVVSLAMLCHPVGISLTGLAAAHVLPAFGWQVLFVGAGFMPVAVAAILWLALPESPAWLRRTPHGAARASELLKSLGLPEPEQTKPARQEGTPSRIRDLFAPSLRGKVMGLLAGFFFSYFAMTMVLSWLPALLATSGYSEKAAGSALFVWSMAGVAGIFFAGLLTGRFGVGRVIVGHLFGAILALAAIALALPASTGGSLPLWFEVLIVVGGYMMNGTMTSLYALATASFAPEVRASGIGLSATMGRAGAIIGALLGAQAIGLVGTQGFFSAAAAAVLLALLGLLSGGGVRLSSNVERGGAASVKETDDARRGRLAADR